MKSTLIRSLAMVAMVALMNLVTIAQQPDNEARITRMRSTIQQLKAVVSNIDIPPETRDQLNDLLFEKRAELHSLLRQKRDTLAAKLRTNLSPQETRDIALAIQALNEEMRGLRAYDQQIGPVISGNGTTLNDNKAGQPVQPAPQSSVVPTHDSPAVVASTQDTGLQPDIQPLPQDERCTNLKKGNATSLNDQYQYLLRRVACRILLGKEKKNDFQARLAFLQDNDLIALGLSIPKINKVAIPELTAQAENASTSKQVGGNESNGGSTSVATKAGLPAVLGFAVENGALARTTSGTTVTFTGNPVGIVQAMAKKGFIESFQDQDSFTKFLRRFSFGLSFDTSRGNQPGALAADRQQLSGYSFKSSLVDQRDPRSAIHTARWEALTSKQAADLASSLNGFVRLLVTSQAPNLDTWLKGANEALAPAVTLDEVQTVLKTQLDKLGDVKLPAAQQAAVEAVATNFDSYLKERNDILGKIANGWLVTLEYNNQRPLGMRSLSDFRFLAEKGAYKGAIDFTGNASMTFYNSKPAGSNQGALRDFRFAGQLDVPFGDVTRTGKFLLSFAGRYQRLLAEEKILGTSAVISKGDIALGQVKLTIPIRGTAIKIPISFSVANRTELIREKEVRGNFGLTFDLDSLFAKFNPFTAK